MSKLQSLLLVAGLSAFPLLAEIDSPSEAETPVTDSSFQPNSFITDELFIYVHAGPSTNYRILGSVNAGDPITLLNGAENDYVQIIDAKGREGWVESKYVTSVPGLKQQLDTSNTRIQLLESELISTQETVPVLQAENQTLQEENTLLVQKIKTLESDLETQVQTAQEKVQAEQHMLLAYGGGIGIGGILIGIVLTLILSRRQRYDNW